MQNSQRVYSYFYITAYWSIKVLNKLEFIKLRNDDIYGQVPPQVWCYKKKKERSARETSFLNGQRNLNSIFVPVRATGFTSQNIAQAGSVVCSSEFPEVNVEDEERGLHWSFTVINTTTSENVRSSVSENKIVDAEQPRNYLSVDNETVPCSTAATTVPLSSSQQGKKLYDFNISVVENEYSSAVQINETVWRGHERFPLQFPDDNTERSFPFSVLKMKFPNGEFVPRDWLVWCKIKQALFCFPCRSFCTSSNRSSFATPSGYSTQKWK